VSESSLERSCCLLARKRGVRSVKLQSGITGEPDRLFLLPGGRCWLVEFKQRGGRVSPRQKIVHAEYEAIGHRVSVMSDRVGFKVALDSKLQATVD
jgi:hypothetical protein